MGGTNSNSVGVRVACERMGRQVGACTAMGRLCGMWRVLLVLASVLVGVLVLSCGSALGLSVRGHVFGSSFGGVGVGGGEFEGASGVAVDEATGAVYVVDAGGERVEIFKPGGSGGFEYVSEFGVRSPGAIVVDNSTSGSDPSRGDVYVVGAEEKDAGAGERDLVYEYSPSVGAVIHKWKKFKVKEEELEFEDVSGVAVDAAGVLWVYWDEEGVIDGFSKQPTKGEGVRLVWEPALQRTPEIEGLFTCAARPGFAVTAGDEAFYVGYEHESASEECPGQSGEPADPLLVAKLNGAAPAPGVLAGALDHENTTGVAVDEASGEGAPLGKAGRGVVYLDEGSSVAAFTSSGVLVQQFGAGQVTGGAGIAVDSATGDVFVPELDAGMVDVFVPESVVTAPVVDGVSAAGVGASSERLSAQIDPRGGETEYYFQYGTVDCALSTTSCRDSAVGKLAAGFGDQEVSLEVTGLEPGTAYFYRVLASNAVGGVEGAPAVDAFTTLPSAGGLPDGRAWEMVSPPDKHGAAVEMVSRSRGASIQAAAGGDGLVWAASGPVVSEPLGNRSFELAQLISRRGPEGWETASLETPHDNGRGLLLPAPSEYHYFSPELGESLVAPTEPAYGVGGVLEDPPLSPEASEKTPYVRSEDPPADPGYVPLVTAADDTAGTKFGGALEFLGATSDLSHVILESKVGLTAAAPSAAGLYEWETGKPLALVSVLPDGLPAPDETVSHSEPALGDGGDLNARDAISADGSRVFWTEEVHQLPERLYLRDTQTGETVQVNAAQGQGSTEPGEGGGVLPEPGEGEQEVHFQSASSDGSRVFFTDTARLTEDSGQEPVGEEAPADLYEFEVTSDAGEPLRGRLSDLTPDPITGSGDVLNLIPGIGEDGSRVYFVANGVLAAGATPGECVRDPEAEAPLPPAGATCNLYVSEPDPQAPGVRQTRFIAALSDEDAADWGAGLTSNLPPSKGNIAAVTSSVSANGHYLAFMSDQSLTGYDNHNATGGEADEEVFLYDAQSGRLVCASCNPNSENGGFKHPEGVFDTELAGEGLGLLVDRPEVWRDRWLAGSIPGWTFNIFYGAPAALYQPRYLSDTGRLFFDSSDALVPADENGKEDVYEYEPERVGSCGFSSGCIGLISSGTSGKESAFLEASENGNDVFFLTAAQLVPADTDNAYDIYDARVCTEASPCLASNSSSVQECETTGSCRPVSGVAPQVPAVASATFSGPGNIAGGVLPSKTLTTPKPKPLTRKQKLAAALKTCKKLKTRHRRVVCERQARKRYATKPKGNSKPKAKKSQTVAESKTAITSSVARSW
jgi:hypothetical protein